MKKNSLCVSLCPGQRSKEHSHIKYQIHAFGMDQRSHLVGHVCSSANRVLGMVVESTNQVARLLLNQPIRFQELGKSLP